METLHSFFIRTSAWVFDTCITVVFIAISPMPSQNSLPWTKNEGTPKTLSHEPKLRGRQLKRQPGSQKLRNAQQVANLDQDEIMKLSIQFLTLTIAMAVLTISQAKLGGSGMRHLQSGQCEICSKTNKNRPGYLTIEYVPQAVSQLHVPRLQQGNMRGGFIPYDHHHHGDQQD